MFCVIEGIDGAGKSTLAGTLRGQDGLTVVLKDDVEPGGSFADKRLAQMHDLTWSYDTAEPVWTYSRRYWLHTLAAWFWFLWQQRLAEPLADPGSIVVTDGWYFKHLARFTLSDDRAFLSLAHAVFAELPQPDVVVLVDTPASDAHGRLGTAVKPSEAGAFDDATAATSTEGFTDYQARTRGALVGLLDDHPATMLTVTSSGDDVCRRLLELGADS